jgi:hypothetical protein
VPCQVDAVGHQVAEDAGAGVGHLEAPRQDAAGICGVVGEQAEPGMRHRPDPPRLDEAARVRHRGGVAVVVADGALDAHHRQRGGDRSGLGGVAPDRLLDPQVPARLRHRHADLGVEVVGGGDAHRLDPWVLQQLAPGRQRPLEPEPPRGLGAVRQRVGDGDQARWARQPREVMRQPDVGARVDLAHPAEPDHADADLVTDGLAHGGSSRTRRPEASSLVRPSRAIRSNDTDDRTDPVESHEILLLPALVAAPARRARRRRHHQRAIQDIDA